MQSLLGGLASLQRSALPGAESFLASPLGISTDSEGLWKDSQFSGRLDSLLIAIVFIITNFFFFFFARQGL